MVELYRKDGILYSSKAEYEEDSAIDRQIRRVRQKHISHNIDKDLRQYIKREKRLGCLRWNP